MIYDYIIKSQLTDKFCKSCVVLKIDVTDLKLEDEFEYLNKKWYLYYQSKDDMKKNNLHITVCVRTVLKLILIENKIK
jgi:hypothetical protein